MRKATLKLSANILVICSLLVFGSNAQAGWLQNLFGPNDCELLRDSNLLILGNCEGSVKKYTESDQLPYPAFKLEQPVETPSLLLTRITDNESKLVSEQEDSHELRHHYSRRQAWNLDETLIDLGERIIIDGSYQPLLDYEPLSSARNWSNKNADILIGIYYDPLPNSLVSFNVRTEHVEVLRKFTDYDKCSFGKGEGNLSNNDQRLLLSCIAIETGELTLISYDLENDRILGTMKAEDNFNWGSFSQSGKFIVVENNQIPETNPELLRYSHELKNPELLSTDPAHGDLGLDYFGNDVYVMIYSTYFESIDLATGRVSKLSLGGWRSAGLGSGHVSCRSTSRPGWCYISSYTGKRLGAIFISDLRSSEPKSDETYFKKRSVSGPTAYEHWGYHRSTIESYRVISKATVSRTGKKILFTSDWYGEQPANDYILKYTESSQ